MKTVMVMVCVAVTLGLSAPAASVDGARTATSPSLPEVNGVLRELDGVEVLTLWGTSYEMGYSHGFLLGPRIMEVWDRELVQGYWNLYAEYLPRTLEVAAIPPHHLNEFEGMLAGMTDNPDVELYVPQLGREFGVDDLIALNCSSFPRCEAMAVWGDLTEDGSTIAARNFGYAVVPYSYPGTTMLDNTLLIAYDPSRTGARRHFTVAWPGIIGCITGMNEAGVTLFINNGGDGQDILHSPNPPTPHSVYPCPLVMREILEVGNTDDPVYAAFEIFQSVRISKGWIVTVASPHTGGIVETAGVIEADSEGQVLRLSSDDYPHNPNRIFACNSYQKYHHVTYDVQYRAMQLGVRLISQVGGWKLGDGAVQAIMAFGSSVGGVSATQHSLILHPNDLTFDVYIAKVVEGVLRNAIYCVAHPFVWSDLWVGDS
ncbi:hypothetical protein AMJ71_02970 [candidate division TA06 bacterium SM1_40]|uniref:Uncharacterized protein n=2 Tax=Bacteria division TA06 TaxID=1156500 RepID=A0A0S8JL45_UNCT6|nr:MAG: hypothetical protein AMJ82_03030 [candidate division TA06 bacterium SM23_40]KPL10489.1 MAG: hypothetical protein AMJ71_02970 [candidate division TA06 bacterium SM1_40]